MKRLTIALSAFALFATRTSAPAAEPAPAPRPVARPGEALRGHKLTASAPTRLPFGLPLDVRLSSRQASTQPPYLRLIAGGPYRTVVFELTTDRGEVVPLAVEAVGSSGGTPEATFGGARLRPTGPHAIGQFLAPGKYRLRITFDARKDPFDPIGLVGRIETEPVSLTVTGAAEAKLTPEAARQLVADLTAKGADTRLKAVYGVPVTTDEEVLAALVGLLADPHEVEEASFTFTFPPSRVRPVARAAVNALAAQGPAAIGPLLDFAKKPANAGYREQAANILGQLGPDKRSVAFLRDFADKGSHNERCAAVHALGRLGPEGVPELIRVARDGAQNDVVRRLAIEELARYGTAETVGPFLREAVKFKDNQHRWAAAQVIGALEYRAALPDLKRLAENEQAEQNVRADALRSFVALADRRDSRELVRKLLASPSASARGKAAMILGGVGDRDDVPRLLELLKDEDVYVRAQADYGLRGLADKPEGVGYDAGRENEPELWRAYWRGK